MSGLVVTPPEATSTSQGRVLIVDDEEPIRMALGRTLRRLGFEITCAADADAGLAAVTTTDPEAVFLDLRMPGTDGHTFLRRLQAADSLVSAVITQHHRDTPPGTHHQWWCLFVLGDHLATAVSGEEDPTTLQPWNSQEVAT